MNSPEGLTELIRPDGGVKPVNHTSTTAAEKTPLNVGVLLPSAFATKPDQLVAFAACETQIASGPRSPVLIRMQSSSGNTKILPSPIWPLSPVRPPLMMALIVGSTKASFTAICS